MVDDEKISTGSFDLNKWLFGGYEKDVITMIAGPPGSGKTNFTILENNLKFINNFNPVNYTWIYNNKEDVGFIAQEVEEFAPNLVSEFKSISDGKMYKSLKYEKIIPYIVG